MSISNARAVYGLSATGTNSRTKVSGSATIGETQQAVALTGANVGYSFLITFAANSNVVTLDLETGIATATTGSPTITHGDGKDFQGVALALSEASILYGILIQTGSTNSEYVAVADIGGTGLTSLLAASLLANQTLLMLAPSNTETLGSGTPNNITFTSTQFGGSYTAGDTVTVTVIAKSA